MFISQYSNDYGFRGRAMVPTNGASTPLAALSETENYVEVSVYNEKIKSSPGGIDYPIFLPYYDTFQNVAETAEQRIAYRRMFADPNIKGAILGKINSIMPLELKYHPPNDRSERDRLIANFCQWNLVERIEGGSHALIWNIVVHALIDGFSVNEPVWAIQEKGKYKYKRVLDALKPKDVNQDLVLLIDGYRNIVGVKALRYNAGEVYDPRDFVIFSHLGLFGNPTGMSDLRAAYRSWWMIDTVTKIRAMGAEKRALPIVAGEYPDSTKAAKLDNILSRIKSQNWVSVPLGVRLKVLEVAGQAEDYFKSFIEDQRQEIFLGIQGATLQALAAQRGVRVGRSSIHKDKADLFSWVLSQMVLDLLNGQSESRPSLTMQMVDPNFVCVEEYPRASFTGVDEAELLESGKIDQMLTEIGFIHSKRDLSTRYGRKWAEDASDAVMPPMPGASGLRPSKPLGDVDPEGRMGMDGSDNQDKAHAFTDDVPVLKW